jgi:hypothetical protein
MAILEGIVGGPLVLEDLKRKPSLRRSHVLIP